MDSLNRHYLHAYEPSSWAKTPNIDRLSKKGVVFQRHFAGSLPCMPARRDLWTGRLSFLETPWGPRQPYDVCLTNELRSQRGVYSHLITDHYHYFEQAGSGYHTTFDSWEFVRGQESDPWHPMVHDPNVPVFRGRNKRQYWVNRTFADLQREENYPTPQCFQRALDFLENNHGDDNWHLHLEVFDPHEPFVAPKEYRDLYQDDWDARFHFDWPAYAPVDPDIEDDAAIRHIRRSYAATLTMADAWLGKLFDKMDELGMWEDTAVILTTDHGHLLGEHGYWAKNYMYDYRELVHIPLIIYHPHHGVQGARSNALTSIIDLNATILDIHDAQVPSSVQGRSLLHLLDGDATHHRTVMYGYFGKDVSITDGNIIYTRQPRGDSVVHHHTAILPSLRPGTQVEVGTFLERFEYPVYRLTVPSRRHHGAPDGHLLYDLNIDPHQEHPLHNVELETEWASRLRTVLNEYEAPRIQFSRLGLE